MPYSGYRAKKASIVGYQSSKFCFLDENVSSSCLIIKSHNTFMRPRHPLPPRIEIKR